MVFLQAKRKMKLTQFSQTLVAAGYSNMNMSNCVFLPVHVDARLGEHEVPQVHEGQAPQYGGEAVVDEHDAVGAPQGHEDHHNHKQHLDHL